MKYVKMLGLLAVAAAALMAFAASASATTLTSPTGTTYTGEIHAVASSDITLHGAATITCKQSTVSGTVETHGTNTTVHGPISTLTFSECNQDVKVLTPGKLIIHPDPNTTDGDGTLTSSGAEVTITLTGLGISCIYGTAGEERDIGTLTSSHTTATGEPPVPGTPVFHISAKIRRIGHSIFCGGEADWTGTYTVTTPDTLWVD